ncbi:NAD(P)-dependent oxidoreductase [Candidatus Parcubacteria bacterium]|nr:MAG: NAD(P)-dependent oxidoreductase [Candidatus Parcubacteria bacterium]
MKKKHKNILLTGGAGFLATHLVPDLIKEGYNVTIVDRYEPNVRNVKFVEADFSNELVMKPLLEDVDAVFHLAAVVGVDKCRLNPEKVIKINYSATKNFIDLCVKANIKKFMFTSSSEVYGNSPDVPYKENGHLEPISTYGKTKVLIEKYLEKVSKESNMRVGIVRLFNVYGPHQRKHFVVPIFVDLALQGDNLPLLGDGNQIRCFTYVKDATEGIVKLFEYDKSTYEIINIGRRYESTMNDLAQLILKCIPTSKSKLEYKQYGRNGIRESDLEIKRRVPSVDKAKMLLGFEAKTSLEEGIKAIL